MILHNLQAEHVQSMVGRGIGRAASAVAPRQGWIRTIRQALGMPKRALAKRVGVAPPNVIAAERRELTGAISLKQLRRYAEALECDLVYGLVPRRRLTEILDRRAEELARKEVDQIAHSMALEDQATAAAFQERMIKEAKRRLLEKPSRLWRSK